MSDARDDAETLDGAEVTDSSPEPDDDEEPKPKRPAPKRSQGRLGQTRRAPLRDVSPLSGRESR
jgi:hypothetical protein